MQIKWKCIPLGGGRQKKQITCNPHFFNTSLLLFPLFPLPSIPFSLVLEWKVPIYLCNSGQASGRHHLQEGFTDPPTITFRAGPGIHHTLPSRSTYMSVFFNKWFLEVKDNVFCAMLGSWSKEHSPFPQSQPLFLNQNNFWLCIPFQIQLYLLLPSCYETSWNNSLSLLFYLTYSFSNPQQSGFLLLKYFLLRSFCLRFPFIVYLSALLSMLYSSSN